jgi:hypothetical protein
MQPRQTFTKDVPAEIVLVCGLFGNLSDADIRRTIRHLPVLCTDRASVLWTLGRYLAEQIRVRFVETGSRRCRIPSCRRAVWA